MAFIQKSTWKRFEFLSVFSNFNSAETCCGFEDLLRKFYMYTKNVFLADNLRTKGLNFRVISPMFSLNCRDNKNIWVWESLKIIKQIQNGGRKQGITIINLELRNNSMMIRVCYHQDKKDLCDIKTQESATINIKHLTRSCGTLT